MKRIVGPAVFVVFWLAVIVAFLINANSKRSLGS